MDTDLAQDVEADVETAEHDQIVLVELTNDGMFGMKKNQW